MKRVSLLFITIILVIPHAVLQAQMPDWKYFKDREGNSYYYDRAFKIRIPDTEGLDYIPVSATGIDFYYNTGMELISEGKYPEGLYYLKSIRSLDGGNNRIKKVQIEAARRMNYLEKKHGTRYELYDQESAVMMTGEKNVFNVINSKLYYRITLPHRPHLIKKGWKLYDRGYGLKFGARIDEKGGYEGFDYVTGVESRIFPGPAPSLDEALKGWIFEMGIDALQRTEIMRRSDRILYELKYRDGTPFSGIEGVYVSGSRAHLVRVFFHESVKGAVSETAKGMLENMVIVH